MEKIILSWNENKNMYDIREATSEDIAKINEIHNLMDDIKRFYYEVINDADDAGMPIDTFIDNECYSAWSHTCQQAEKVNSLAKEVGIDIDAYQYIHTF